MRARRVKPACNWCTRVKQANHEISSGCLSQFGDLYLWLSFLAAELRGSSNRAAPSSLPDLSRSSAIADVSQPAYELVQAHDSTKSPEHFSGEGRRGAMTWFERATCEVVMRKTSDLLCDHILKFMCLARPGTGTSGHIGLFQQRPACIVLSCSSWPQAAAQAAGEEGTRASGCASLGGQPRDPF